MWVQVLRDTPDDEIDSYALGPVRSGDVESFSRWAAKLPQSWTAVHDMAESSCGDMPALVKQLRDGIQVKPNKLAEWLLEELTKGDWFSDSKDRWEVLFNPWKIEEHNPFFMK